MMGNNKIIKYKESFIIKIKTFFLNIFKKSTIKEENISINVEQKEEGKNDFKESIIIKEDPEKVQMLKLQKDYKEGKISEEQMSSEQYSKLIDLYKSQNESIREKIEIELKELKRILNGNLDSI